MKGFIFLSAILISISIYADIDATSDKGTPPTPVEISNYRSCFHELEREGCRHPSEDSKNFVVCMRESFSSLTSECKEMMSTLYGK